MFILDLVQKVLVVYSPKNANFLIVNNKVEFNFIDEEHQICLKYENNLERLSIISEKPLPSFVQDMLKNFGFKTAGRYQVLKFTSSNTNHLLEVLSTLLKLIDQVFNLKNKDLKKNNKKVNSIDGNYLDNDGNMIEAPKNLHNCRSNFQGTNNKIVIHPETKIRNVSIQCLGNNAQVYIGKDVRMSGNWRLGYNCYLTIKDRATSTNAVYITCAEATGVSIGEDCMFATSNQIRTDDAHAIYEVETGRRINLSESIEIGDHVWVSYGATIFGGSRIGSGSIVGAFSLTNKTYPNNCIIAGTPAKVVKEDVCWERPNVLYEEEPAMYVKENAKSSNFYCVTKHN